MSTHYSFHLWVCVKETNNHSFPSTRSRHVEEEEEKHLKNKGKEEDSVGQLKHQSYYYHTSQKIISKQKQ